jgi:hypothetical protein
MELDKVCLATGRHLQTMAIPTFIGALGGFLVTPFALQAGVFSGIVYRIYHFAKELLQTIPSAMEVYEKFLTQTQPHGAKIVEIGGYFAAGFAVAGTAFIIGLETSTLAVPLLISLAALAGEYANRKLNENKKEDLELPYSAKEKFSMKKLLKI